MKYFVFNKALDFERCLLHNMRYEDHRLKARAQGKEHSCYMVSRILDSKEADMQWHQLLCRMRNEGNTAVEAAVYTTNSLTRQVGGREENIECLLFDEAVSLQEKKALLRPYLQKTVWNTDDILLHDIRGRYFWFILETTLQDGQSLEFEKIWIYFPRQSWTSYLPEIYQGQDADGFLGRFLAVFQTMYETLNRQIERLPYQIDIDCANREFLEWLAKWLDIAQSYIWTDGQLRRLLKNAAGLYQARGTKRAVAEFVKLYTGSGNVYVVERFQIQEKGQADPHLLIRLYGNDPYRFQVIVLEEDVPTVREYQTLLTIIKEAKPAYMEAELIVLKPYLFLGQHTYLGLNSVLGRYKHLSLDGAGMMSLTVLGDGQTRFVSVPPEIQERKVT